MTDDEEIGAAITQVVENQTDKKIFTMRTFDHEHLKNGLEVIVIFEDKTVMMGSITIYKKQEQIVARCKLNYV
jgi:hypothetical protein